MSRDVGQVPTSRALAGLLVVVAAVAGVVVLSEALRLPVEPLQGLAPPRTTRSGPACPAPPGRSVRPMPVDSAGLLQCPELYDGLRVRYRGEVVAAVLRRGRRAWVQLNDDLYGTRIGPLPGHRNAVGLNSGMAVSIPVEVAADVDHVGDDREQGDQLLVVGTYLRADPADGGGPAIQAQRAEIVRRGRVVVEPTSEPRLLVAIGLGLVTIAAYAGPLRRPG
ncbi:MAG: hypothetical protein KY434_04335 [Actinobacteria bacterium]|nr:hypothetical protein [Actinomycetota bacterium]